MGLPGSGKSTFINLASGCDTRRVNHTLRSLTNDILPISFWDHGSGRRVVLVDTPGFDNTPRLDDTPGFDDMFKTESEILNMISDWLDASYKKPKHLSGILYIQRITDNRVAGTPLKNLRLFQKLCGKDALGKVHLTTTMWDEVDQSVGEKRLKELGAEYWKAMIDQGSQIVRCRRDDDSAKKYVQQILVQEATRKAAPLQGERRQTVGYPKVAEQPPAIPQPPPQAIAEQCSQTDGERLEAAQGPQGSEEPPTTVNIEDLGTEDIVIAVMGPTGSGKSMFINLASGYDTRRVNHTLRSLTNDILAIRFWDHESGQHVVLVDIPGFDDMFKSEIETVNMISDWLNASYKKKKLLSGILYLHRITDTRMAGKPLRNLRMFQKMCGRDALDKVYLTTTMWDEVDQSVGEKRLHELAAEYWKAMIQQGAQIVRCRSDDDSPKKIIQQILDQEATRRVALLQVEMADLKKELRETEAGQELYSQLEKLVEKQMVLLQRIDKERKAAQDSDASVLVELQAEYNELRDKIDDRLRQMQELKLSWFRRVRRLFSRTRE
ncbi:hypothetical protein OG21DRAFT_1245167 [Imleria badia]|nr:hypothetical protein OG21DRAFT_1245167 [Imleria badia]